MNLKPKLVLGESGKVCMQITLGNYSLTEEIPDRLAQYTMAELQDHFNSIVPAMARKLLSMQRRKERKFRKKVECGNRKPSQRVSAKPSDQLSSAMPSQLP